LALADELTARGVELLYVGTADGPEARLATEAGLEFAAVSVAGFVRSKPLTLVTSSLKALRGMAEARTVLRTYLPAGTSAAAICFGGYVSIPVGLAVLSDKIPLIVHEQNAHMGMTNRFLARRASFTALTYPKTTGLPGSLSEGLLEGHPFVQKESLESSKQSSVVEFVGNPVRRSILASDAHRAREQLGIPQCAKVLLVFGGSRGARSINQALVAGAEKLLMAEPDLHIVHSTGPLEYDGVREDLGLRGVQEAGGSDRAGRYHVVSYIEDMGDMLASATLVVSRAGATSIAEIAALGKPSVLIPYPFATEDHQSANARSLVALGGARLINDDQLDTAIFADTLLELLSDDKLRSTMGKQAATLGKPEAAARLADIVIARAEPFHNR